MKWLRKSISIFAMLLFVHTSYAQLGFCSGNSGDAIFTETFGVGATYGPQLPAGTTTYNFVANSGPQDGEYTIGSNTFSYGWNLPSDHTPNDTNGKCLIVNANFTSGEFYKRTVSGLCENTTYEFSSWVKNILPSSGCGGNGIPVNVRFEIWDNSNINLLASGNTGNIFGQNSPNWIQYGLVFQTLPGQTSVILKMINNGIGGCGNDLAIDDIVFKTCGDSVVIETINADNSFEACEDSMVTSVPLNAIPDFSVFSSHAFQWQVSSNGITWADISGANNNTYNAPAPIPFGNLFYRVKFAESSSNLQNSSCNSFSEIFEITINPLVTPSFNSIPPICNGGTFALPSTSTNGITGTWSPALNNMTTTTYTFTPNAGQCARNRTLIVTVNQPVTPNFNAIAPICSGTTISLPTTSTNMITGIWSPAINNTTTTTYTFTPNTGQCATTQTLTIVVNQPITPTFIAVPAICSGDALSALPTTSTNGINGVWSPALNNTTTTTYTFTPNAGQCARNQTLIVTVNQPVTPTFAAVSSICIGEALSPLPTTSTNGINGAWSPALNNTTTTTYTFSPNAGQCARNQTLIVTVNQPITPTFAAVSSICIGEALSPLPTTSTNGINGAWSPALNNTTTTTYTFTPNVGQCASNQMLTIIVNQSTVPTFEPIAPLCSGDTLLPLPITSTNNITGTWSPELNNTITTTYTFTPDVGQCPNLVSLTIVVNSNPRFELDENYVICSNTNGTEIIQSPTIFTNLSETDFSFEWTNEAGDVVGINSSFLPLTAGIYTVLVTNIVTRCESDASTLVIESSPPDLRIVQTSDPFSDTYTIEVSATGSGDYEYRLDNGSWQDSPIFTNVSAGDHVITARDKNGCGFTNIDVCLIGYSKYFTPNDDGFNDTWNIKGASCINNAEIFIFDRFGKLLKQINFNGLGWNGTFNGSLLPTSDYWFVIKYIESGTTTSKEFRGNFTLKR